MNKDLFEPMAPISNNELFAREEQESRQTLGKTIVEPTTNLQLTETVLPTAPLNHPNQAIKGGTKGRAVDKLQSAQWVQHYYPATSPTPNA